MQVSHTRYANLVPSIAVMLAVMSGGAGAAGGQHPGPGDRILQTAQKKPDAKSKKLPPVIFVSRAFRDAPAPAFKTIRLKTSTVSGDIQLTEVTDLTLQSWDDVVTAVKEDSLAEFSGENANGGPTRTRTTGETTYVLGGLLLVDGLWTTTETAGENGGGGNGGPKSTTQGAEVKRMTRVAGRLFPLKVGNTLELRFTVSFKGESRATVSERSYKITRKIKASAIHKRLPGHIFVIEATYREQVGRERFSGLEVVYYAENLGWPVGTRRTEDGTRNVIETRLVEFTPAEK